MPPPSTNWCQPEMPPRGAIFFCSLEVMQRSLVYFGGLLIFCSIANAQLFPTRGLGGNLAIANCPNKNSPATYPTIPTSYDLRQTWSTCITPILDQGSCGWCVKTVGFFWPCEAKPNTPGTSLIVYFPFPCNFTSALEFLSVCVIIGEFGHIFCGATTPKSQIPQCVFSARCFPRELAR